MRSRLERGTTAGRQLLAGAPGKREGLCHAPGQGLLGHGACRPANGRGPVRGRTRGRPDGAHHGVAYPGRVACRWPRLDRDRVRLQEIEGVTQAGWWHLPSALDRAKRCDQRRVPSGPPVSTLCSPASGSEVETRYRYVLEKGEHGSARGEGGEDDPDHRGVPRRASRW